MAKNMTVGNPIKLILLFSIPLLIGNVFQQFYSMVDTVIVGRFLGVQALAAVGATGALSFLIVGFILGLTSGFSVITSQRFGADDRDGIKKSVATSVILCIVITALVTLISVIFAKPVLQLMNTPSDIIDDSLSYIIVIFGGLFTAVFYNMIASILRALGDSKTPLYFLIVSSVLNIFLDIIFIVYFSMGVSGAAYATVISQGISGVLCLIYAMKKYSIIKPKKEHWKFDKDLAIQHFKIGLPMAFQFSIIAVGVMVVQTALNGLGSTVVGAFTAASKVEQLVMQPAITFGVTMATYTAQNLGAGRIDRIKDGVKKCLMIAVIVSIVSGIVVVTFGEAFTRLFITDATAEVIGYSRQYLNTVSIFFLPLSFLFIFRNAIQGLGDGFIPMLAGIVELLTRVIVAFTLPALIDYAGICLASPLSWITACTLLTVSYFKKIKGLSFN